MENDLVTIIRITKPAVGSFVKNKFESEGIECFFTNEGLTMGSTYNPNEVLLKVKAIQSEKAIKLLLQIHKDYDLDKIIEDKLYEKTRKILIPVRISEQSYNLCIFALKLAKKIHAEVKLLYVYEDPTIHEQVKHTVSWEKHVKLELMEAHKKAQLKLVDFSIELNKILHKKRIGQANLHYRMLKGIPENVITEAGKRYEPDLIIVGSATGSASDSEFETKTISRIVENTNHPVLIVPPDSEFKEDDELRVMYATDFYESDNSSMNKLLYLLRTFNKRIFCVHIDLKDDPLHQQKVDTLNEMLKREYSVHNIQCVLFKSDTLVGGFEDFADKNNIHLISLSKIKRSAFYRFFHTDMVERILSIKKYPILLFSV